MKKIKKLLIITGSILAIVIMYSAFVNVNVNRIVESGTDYSSDSTENTLNGNFAVFYKRPEDGNPGIKKICVYDIENDRTYTVNRSLLFDYISVKLSNGRITYELHDPMGGPEATISEKIGMLCKKKIRCADGAGGNCYSIVQNYYYSDDGNDIYQTDLDTGDVNRIITLPCDEDDAGVWLIKVDGSNLYISNDDCNELYVYSLDNNQMTHTYDMGKIRPSDICSYDGDVFVADYLSDKLYLLHPENDSIESLLKVSNVMPEGKESYAEPKLLINGDSIYCFSNDLGIYKTDRETGDMKQLADMKKEIGGYDASDYDGNVTWCKSYIVCDIEYRSRASEEADKYSHHHLIVITDYDGNVIKKIPCGL